MAPCNGTTFIAPSNRTRSSPSPPPTIAHYNGTLQMAPRPLSQSWSSPSPSTIVRYNGTTSTAPCNGTLVPCPIRQSGSSPSPLLEVRTPIAIAIWGKMHIWSWFWVSFALACSILLLLSTFPLLLNLTELPHNTWHSQTCQALEEPFAQASGEIKKAKLH